MLAGAGMLPLSELHYPPAGCMERKSPVPFPRASVLLSAEPGCVAMSLRSKVGQPLVSASLPLCLYGVLSVLLFRVNKLFI